MNPMTPSQPSTVWLVRHGQSLANAGGTTHDFSQIPLTAFGNQQAELFAERFQELSLDPPTLIVQSPYLRARETAAPLCQRFPDVPVETWPIQEFTYMNPLLVDGLIEIERDRFYARYWLRDDPNYRDGGGAESFIDFLNRVRVMLSRFSVFPARSRVVVFTHGYVMQAVRLLLLFSDLTDHEMMSRSRNLNEAVPIQNTDMLELQIVDGRLNVLAQEHITPITLQGVISHE